MDAGCGDAADASGVTKTSKSETHECARILVPCT